MVSNQILMCGWNSMGFEQLMHKRLKAVARIGNTLAQTLRQRASYAVNTLGCPRLTDNG